MTANPALKWPVSFNSLPMMFGPKNAPHVADRIDEGDPSRRDRSRRNRVESDQNGPHVHIMAA